MRHVTGAFAIAGVLLLLAGCTTSPPSSAPSAPAGSPHLPPAPTPTPTDPGRLVITVDGVDYAHAGRIESVEYTDGTKLVALFEEVAGTRGTIEDVKGYPDWNTDGGRTLHSWDGVRVSVPVHQGGPAYVFVTAAVLNGVPIESVQGISVGSTRTEVLSHGGADNWDEDGDGVADYLRIGDREVPGTNSLTRPGHMGMVFVNLRMDGDTVVEILVPSDDFSDL